MRTFLIEYTNSVCVGRCYNLAKGVTHQEAINTWLNSSAGKKNLIPLGIVEIPTEGWTTSLFNVVRDENPWKVGEARA